MGACTLVTVVAYGWVVGGDPSVARAVTAACVYLGASLIGLSPAPLAVLRTVAIGLVLWTPMTVIDPGAWLSFGATLGIISLATRGVPAVSRSGPNGSRERLIRVLVMAVAATLAAEALVLPISAAVFGRVSIAGVVLNLIAVPAMAVVQIAGCSTVSLAPVWPAAAAASGDLARVSAEVLVGSSGLVDVLPWLSWRVPPPSRWWTLAYFFALGCALVTTARRRRVAVGVAGTALAVILTAPTVSRAQPRADRVRVTVIDVGQGDAILVQAGGGFSLLVDTGGGVGPFDVGGRVVTPAAWALGTRRLTSLALTHGDRDHAGGALAVMRDLAPRDVWEGVPVPRDPDRARLRALATSLGSTWRTVQSGSRVEWGELTIEAWHPPVPEWERQKVRNDDSLVLRLRYGHADIWLTGDAGREFESQVATIPDLGRLRILKVGHHGSRTSSSARFLAALRPQIAVVSAGRGNLFGHPAPEVLARFEAAGASVFRTDRDGAVVIETDGSTVRVQTALGRTWTVSVPPGPP